MASFSFTANSRSSSSDTSSPPSYLSVVSGFRSDSSVTSSEKSTQGSSSVDTIPLGKPVVPMFSLGKIDKNSKLKRSAALPKLQFGLPPPISIPPPVISPTYVKKPILKKKVVYDKKLEKVVVVQVEVPTSPTYTPVSPMFTPKSPVIPPPSELRPPTESIQQTTGVNKTTKPDDNTTADANKSTKKNPKDKRVLKATTDNKSGPKPVNSGNVGPATPVNVVGDGGVGLKSEKKEEVKASVPSKVVAVQPKKEKETVESLQSWLNICGAAVASADKVLIGFCEEQNIPHFSSKNLTTRGHSISNLSRHEAVRRVIHSAAVGDNLSVLDYYGSSRTQKFDPSTSHPVIDVVRDGVKLGTSKTMFKVNITNGGYSKVGGDTARGNGLRETLVIGQKFDLVMCVDIYQGIGDANTPFDPYTAKRLIEHSNNGSIIWIGRLFQGSMGVDDCLEGVWYKNEEDLIVFSAEPHAQCYANHPSINWMHNRQYMGLDIAEQFSIGPYVIFKISLSDMTSISLNMTEPPSAIIQDRPIYLTKEYGFLGEIIANELEPIRPLMPNFFKKYTMDLKYVPVHLETASELKNFALRAPAGSAVDAANSMVLNSFHKDKKLQELRKRMPEQYERLLEGTIFYVMHGEREAVAKNLLRLRIAGRNSEVALKRVRAADLEGNNSGFLSKLAKIIGGGCLGYQAYNCIKMLLKLLFKFVSKYIQFKFGINQFNVYRLVFNFNYGDWMKLFNLFSQHLLQFLGNLKEVMSYLMTIKYEELNIYKKLVDARNKSKLKIKDYVTVVAEEVTKLAYPMAGLGIGLVESYFSRSPTNFIFHAGTSATYYSCRNSIPLLSLAFASNTMVHLYNNSKYLDASPKGQEFIQAHDDGRYIKAMSSEVAYLGPHANLKSFVTRVIQPKDKIRGTLKLYYKSKEVTLAECCELVNNEEVSDSGMYPLLTNSSLLFRPAKSNANLLCSLILRRLRDPGLPSHENLRHEWSRAVDLAGQVYTIKPQIQVSFHESVVNMKDGGKRLTRAKQEYEDGYIHKLPVKLFVKYDEVIPHKDVGTQMLQWKPRAIMNYHPYIHAALSQVFNQINNCMHENLDGKVHFIGPDSNKVAVIIFFASGYTQEELSAMGQIFNDHCGIVIAMSGDDSLVKFSDYERFNFVKTFSENDQSLFDTTQGEVCLENSHKAFEKMGIDIREIQLAEDSRKVGFTFGNGDLKGYAKTEATLSTGEKGTTCINSHDTMEAYLIHIDRVLRGEVIGEPYIKTFRETAATLGFKTTGFESDDIHEMTFLKGWYVLDQNDSILWYPLPSQVIKAGKYLTNPCVVAKSSDYETTIRVCMNAMHKGYGNVDPSYPIFGKFIQTCGKFADSSADVGLSQNEFKRFRVLVDGKINRSHVCDMMYKRYDLTLEDIERVEKLYDAVTRIPSVVIDPSFNKLVEKDYAGDSQPEYNYYL